MVGLEISMCTGHARRITLWSAIQIFYGANANVELCRLHTLGDFECLKSCSGAKLLAENERKRKKWLTLDEALLNAVRSLKETGLNPGSHLKAWWSLDESPEVVTFESKPGQCNNWFRMMKDTHEVATFAIGSTACFEYAGTPGKYMSCSSRRHRRHSSERNTVLHTRLQMHPDSKPGQGSSDSVLPTEDSSPTSYFPLEHSFD
ncbi:hypothetical protein K402DRAFT_60846 [Aulographum hederae CBS 113979]|uniref:Uncharacterized protein n=1 Tax=Aulographum hederae CBS 113979 TaxID=1176131 RepID=A0A6G1H1Q5_9PEZI|nr:hypothetical protein K402DRAFT_60846 [Aulographum hederae CBS 113979]